MRSLVLWTLRAGALLVLVSLLVSAAVCACAALFSTLDLLSHSNTAGRVFLGGAELRWWTPLLLLATATLLGGIAGAFWEWLRKVNF